MRILVTNDDGVSAPGLAVAQAIAEEVAGPDGEVWTVAPAFEQSGVSHAISYTSAIKMEQLGPRKYACAGTPADCVIVGLLEILKDTPPDLVLSGVNRGHNLAEDAVYSGTLGAALEGALLGRKAIGLSQYFAPPLASDPEAMFEAARAHGAATVRKLLTADWTPDLFFNVNFPPVRAAEAQGPVLARQGRRRVGKFAPVSRTSPSGRPYFWLTHSRDNASTAPEDDAAMCAKGFITVTPMRPDYTDNTALDRLAGLF
ncbi:MAG: 5'/3'-nucleotidase SurE [Neomegalonema sp.]|nr:5'/3'-nucleotidase SurE [Neomegalonema sp.]